MFERGSSLNCLSSSHFPCEAALKPFCKHLSCFYLIVLLRCWYSPFPQSLCDCLYLALAWLLLESVDQNSKESLTRVPALSYVCGLSCASCELAPEPRRVGVCPNFVGQKSPENKLHSAPGFTGSSDTFPHLSCSLLRSQFTFSQTLCQ